jgi:hypothetical protein
MEDQRLPESMESLMEEIEQTTLAAHQFQHWEHLKIIYFEDLGLRKSRIPIVQNTVTQLYGWISVFVNLNDVVKDHLSLHYLSCRCDCFTIEVDWGY